MRHLLPSADRLPWLLPELRARAGLTQPQLAERLGASLPTVQRLESGAHPATMKRTWQLADALGTSVVTLMALIDAAEELGESGEVPAWLDGLSWLPSPGGPLQRPVLVVGSGPPARPPAWEPAPADGDPDTLLLGRVRVLGLLLGQLRARVHLSVADLAHLWGPSASTIKRFERGKGSPDLGELGELGSLLGLTRTELVALAEGLLLHLDHQVPEGRRPELLETVRGWLDSLYWIPNPGEGLLASRPAGHRWRPTAASGWTYPAIGVDVWLAGDVAAEFMTSGRRQEPLLDELVGPAGAALACSLLRGWSVVGAKLPPVPVHKKSLAAVVAAELLRVLDSNGWPASPVLLVRPGRARSRSMKPWMKPPPHLLTATPGEALFELGRGSPQGPWRLVIVDGLATLDESGLGRRQPAPQLQGAALVVLQTDPAARAGDLSHFLGRPVDFTCTAASSMDAGLLPGLRYHGVCDPIPGEGRPQFGGLRPPEDVAQRDDRRLDALADAGAFGDGRTTLVHVVGDEQEHWLRTWLQRRGQVGQALVARRKSARLKLEGPLDELVLLGGYPATRVQQVFEALRRADVGAGLDVWSLETTGKDEANRRTALAAALGAVGSAVWRDSESTWRSPRGRCSLEWAAKSTVEES